MSGSSTSANGSIVVPKLTSGEAYANWKPAFINYCFRIGLAAVLTDEIVQYKQLVVKRAEWTRSEQQSYVSRALASSSSSSSSTDPSSSPMKFNAAAAKQKSDDVKAVEKAEEATMRAHIKRMLEQSERVYGALVDALPLDIRPQVEDDNLPAGYAYGLWKWLGDKYQNTEVANVAELLSQWMNLKQIENEMFDSYRARVNKLRALLEVANERPSDGVYTYILLDRLLPNYSQAVLALKAGDKLKDTSKINWVEVITFINNHERRETKGENDTRDQGSDVAMSATGRDQRARWQNHHNNYGGNGASGGTSGGGPARGPPPPHTKPDARGCFNCGGLNHISRYCPTKGSPKEGGTSERVEYAMSKEDQAVEDQFGF